MVGSNPVASHQAASIEAAAQELPDGRIPGGDTRINRGAMFASGPLLRDSCVAGDRRRPAGGRSSRGGSRDRVCVVTLFPRARRHHTNSVRPRARNARVPQPRQRSPHVNRRKLLPAAHNATGRARGALVVTTTGPMRQAGKNPRHTWVRGGLDFTGGLPLTTRQKHWTLPGSASPAGLLDWTRARDWTLPGLPMPAIA